MRGASVRKQVEMKAFEMVRRSELREAKDRNALLEKDLKESLKAANDRIIEIEQSLSHTRFSLFNLENKLWWTRYFACIFGMMILMASA